MKLKSILLGALALGCACAFGGESQEPIFQGGQENAVVQKLQTCDFLLNKDFKKNAKYYLCLFSASWCGPCRREMPHIAKTYAEQLNADPDIELIHFSRDQNDEKALAWAKEHDVKFPVVKPKGGNPLELRCKGIPHLFIVKADGALVEEGHPAKLFTDENLRMLKAGTFSRQETAIEKPVKPETATEKAQKAITKLFPGWKLDSEIDQHPQTGLHNCHRGQNNVLFVHPKSTEVPVIISRTMTLPEKNPCLFLKVASWNEDADYLLSVRINGKVVLPNRLVSTPDFDPWQDIVVSLAEWRGQNAKVEIVFGANNWWCEAAHLMRLEIAEGKGDMRIKEDKETVNGHTWSYRAQNGEAMIIAEKDGKISCAVSPCPIGQLAIPSTLGGAKVTQIGREAFADCSAITAVTIPEGVTRIGRRAFFECTGLRSVKIPSSVQTLEWDVFGACRGMTSVTLQKGLKNIDRGAFYDCYALTSIELPSSVTYLGRDAFLWCRSLASVTMSSGVTDIRWYAFRGCNALTVMTIPAGVTNIDMTAFCDTGAMTSFRVEEGNRFYKSENGLLLTKDGKTLVRGVNGDVKIPSSVTAIGPCAFEGCVSLWPMVIPKGVKSIGDYAFKQCRGTTAVTIPESVTDIGCEAFNWCSNLKSVIIPHGVSRIGDNAFCDCRELESVTIPSTLKSIGEGVFARCKVMSVSIPNGVTVIGKNAFYDCGNLTTVAIASSVQRIEQGAFHGCGTLASLTIPSTVTSIDRTAFDRCFKLKSVNVVTNGKTEKLTFGEFQKKWMMGGLPGRNRLSQNAVEREEQRQQLLKIQEELKRVREAKAAAAAKDTNSAQKTISVAQKLQTCDFLLNKDFKKNAKYYLCLFSASWCGPCRREMPHIAKTYAEQLNADPDIELIHFSRDQNDEKALAWAKEHDVKFPVVKPKGGNPLELHSRGIPHLFIVNADGMQMAEGHPMRLFTDENIRSLKAGTFDGVERPNLAKGEAVESFGGYNWTYRVQDGKATIVASGRARRCTISPRPKGRVVIPSKLGGVNVTAVGAEAFCACSEMTDVVIPDSVTEIGWQAFGECGSLTTLTIPLSVTKIQCSAFSGCRRLMSFNVSDENRQYAAQDGVLFDKGKKTLICYPGGIAGSYEIPSGVTEISGNAFSGCQGLTSVAVPDSVTRIGEWAFSQSRNLASVTLGSGVTNIGQGPFYWCSGLKTISVNEANQRYSSCDGILFDKDMKTLICCPGGFSGAYAIPSSVIAIGRFAFDSCSRLTSVAISENVTSIGANAFSYCLGLRSVTIPPNVKAVGDWSFSGCRSLSSARISDGVTSLGSGTFCGCFELTSAVIPESVKSTGKYTFSGCRKLISVTMRGERPKAQDNVFSSCDKLTVIHVPANAKSWEGMTEWQGKKLVFDAKAK